MQYFCKTSEPESESAGKPSQANGLPPGALCQQTLNLSPMGLGAKGSVAIVLQRRALRMMGFAVLSKMEGSSVPEAARPALIGTLSVLYAVNM